MEHPELDRWISSAWMPSLEAAVLSCRESGAATAALLHRAIRYGVPLCTERYTHSSGDFREITDLSVVGNFEEELQILANGKPAHSHTSSPTT